MAKNEAKIRFTAETGEFNSAIKKSNDEMSQLRAELKLNATQMKTTGASVEALEDKHRILSNQLAASESKTEALAQKVSKAAEIFGENSTEVNKLRTQLINAQTAEEKIRQAISACNDELEAQKSAMNQAESASEQLANTIKDQQTTLDRLKRDYADAVLQYGKSSDEAKNLKGEISSLSGELRENQTALGKAEKAADDLDKSFDNAGQAADGAGDGFTVLKGVVADLASSAIQAAIGKLTEFIGYLGQLPAETMELRQSMSTLTTTFDGANFSTETAKNTWKELYAVFGDDQTAVEAANHIARMSENQQDLNDWVTISTGLYATYQDAINPAAIAESAKETAACGKVTGQFADALNWSSEAATMFAGYMSDEVTTAEDAFNVALSECSTEQERQALITDTLTALYGDAAGKYRETAGAQMEAKEATAEHMLAENDLASSIEPVTTAWQEMKTMLLTSLQPAIEKITSAMTDALSWMKEHPTAVKAIAAAVSVLAIGLGALSIAWGVYTIAQWAANSAMLIPAAICLGIVAAIAAVVAIIVIMVEHWDQVKAKCSEVWESVKATFAQWGEWINTNVVQPVKEFFAGLWDGIKSACASAWEWVKGVFSSFVSWIDSNVIQPVVNFFTGLWETLQTIWDTICNVIQVAIMFIGSIISGAVQLITVPFRFIWENCKQYVFAAWEWIKNAVSTAINAVKNVITTVMNAIKSFISNVWNGIKSATSTVWNGIKSVITSVWNAIKPFVTSAVNAVKNVVTKVWNGIKSTTSTAWNAVKNVVSTVWNGIKSGVTTAINAVKSVVSSVWNGIKSTTSSIWNGIKSAISSVWNGIKSGVSSAINGVKSTVSSVFNGIKSTATSVWNGIKTAITKPIEAAKTKVKSVVDSIKGFFSNMKLSLPKIKLPHFKVTGKLSLDPPSVPKLSIEWYKEGGIMMKPTIFGMNGSSFMAGGEAGPEAIVPIDRLEGYISGAIEKAQNVVNLQSLVNAIEDLASRPISLNVNGREVALATAGDFDSVNGLRTTFSGRGLVLG